ncbi:MAG: septal ring lytic transglycosylase RlpA family protein [Desulfovibrio sp.]|jgi:rare lipoprotein A|nr:septal ring lytic transglycosylase RlpA family protein [Desulfovibrio sp.]
MKAWTLPRVARRVKRIPAWAALACAAACAGTEDPPLPALPPEPEKAHAVPAPAPPAGGKSYVVKGKRYTVLPSAEGFYQRGRANWYGKRFHGRKTASGERFHQNALTAAHTTLPMNTLVEVLNPASGKKLRVRINDRGPFTEGCVIDLSRLAAARLGLLGGGEVELRAVPDPEQKSSPAATSGKDRSKGRAGALQR